jgi:hypothetical protein
MRRHDPLVAPAQGSVSAGSATTRCGHKHKRRIPELTTDSGGHDPPIVVTVCESGVLVQLSDLRGDLSQRLAR